MYLFSRAYLQLLTELYRSMTPGSRLTAGMLGAVVMLSAGYLVMHQGSSPEVDLMHGVPLAAAQLPAMEAALAKANLKGYEVRGTSIFVPRGQEADYMAALVAANALPPSFGAAQHQAVNGGTMFEFGPQRDQRMRIAKQDELAQAICKMPGIESAYVLYDVDSKPGAFKEKVITATALVKPAGADQLDEALVSAIRKMVAGAIAGLKPENVAVADLNGPHVVWQPRRCGRRGRQRLHLAEANLRAGPEDQNPGRLVFHPQRHRRGERGAGPPAIHPHQAGPALFGRRPTRQPPCDRRGHEG